MSQENDPNLGGFVGSDEEGWQIGDFNLLEYVGEDNSSFELERDRDDLNHDQDEDDTMREKDRYYSTLQYNNVVLTNDQFVDNYATGQVFQQQPYYAENQYANAIDNSLLPSTSKNSATIPIKLEQDMYEDDSSYMNEGSEASFGTRVIPRKYRIKPDSEKKNPVYRAKREKNNDAVRRSRDKAKKEQEKKEGRLRELENKNMKSDQKIRGLEARVKFLEKQLINCTCRTSR